MGAKLSAYQKRRPLRDANHPPPPLLELPQELLDMICSHLSQESVCCLAITCKSLFSVINYELGTYESRILFLCLLEQDLGEFFYLCHGCTKLHRFDKWWKPTNYKSGYTCRTMYNAFEWVNFNGELSIEQYTLGYQLVRLVTNGYMFGANKGLPVKSLEGTESIKNMLYPFEPAHWRRTWSARIINDELFLQARHQIQATDEPALRRVIDESDYQLCSHISIDSERWRNCLNIFWRPQPLYSRGPWAACRNESGSCERCLTDYVLTIETPETFSFGWRISISTYHQLGDGRSPQDWKWMAYRGAMSHEKWPGGRFSRVQRDFHRYPAGLVMRTWENLYEDNT